MRCSHNPVDVDANPALESRDSPQRGGELPSSCVNRSKPLQFMPEVSVSVNAKRERFGRFRKDPSS